MTIDEAIRIIKIVLAVAEDFEIIVQGEEFTKEKCKEAVEIVTNALDQEPCEDAISRQAVLEAIEDDNRNAHYSCFASNYDAQCFKDIIKELPPVTPQYTEAEIQKMQDLEFAEIQKAYEIGKKEGSSEKPNKWIPAEVLDKIRAEIEHIGKATPLIGTNTVIEIIDKYKVSPAGAESEE